MTAQHRSNSMRAWGAALLLVTLPCGLAACGSDDDGGDAGAVATTSAAVSASTASPASTATVATASSRLGTILVDAQGRTLYMFAPDRQGASTCTAQCLANWPALVGPARAGSGVDATMLATLARPDDGTQQVTYAKWPLYHFAGDAKAGDLNGQGVNGVWFVMGADGKPIGQPAGTATTAPAGGSSNVPGY